MAEASSTLPKQTLRLHVRALTFRGDGIARTDDGQVVFLPYAAPGDVVCARVVETKGDYLRAAIEQVETPSPDRVNPPCPHFGRCGGGPGRPPAGGGAGGRGGAGLAGGLAGHRPPPLAKLVQDLREVSLLASPQ